MTDSAGWDLTIIGALLCLVYSWLIAAVGRSQGIRLGKAGPAIGISGALVLAGMAIVGPPHIPEFEGVIIVNDPAAVVVDPDSDIVKGTLANMRRLDLITRTRNKLGDRPSKEHLPWEYPDGRLAWVTKDEYLELRREQRKGEK